MSLSLVLLCLLVCCQGRVVFCRLNPMGGKISTLPLTRKAEFYKEYFLDKMHKFYCFFLEATCVILVLKL